MFSARFVAEASCAFARALPSLIQSCCSASEPFHGNSLRGCTAAGGGGPGVAGVSKGAPGGDPGGDPGPPVGAAVGAVAGGDRGAGAAVAGAPSDAGAPPPPPGP